MPGHEVEAARAAAHDGLPDLDGLTQGTRHQRDLFQRVAAIGDVGGDRVALAVVLELERHARAGAVVERLVPLAESHLVVENIFVPDLEPELRHAESETERVGVDGDDLRESFGQRQRE